MPNAFVHIELNTDDVAAAKKFYKSLFKWKLSEMAPGYTGIDVGKGNGAGGGMQKKAMPDAPTAWLPYVQVDDVTKTVAKARTLGATVQLEYMDIGNMGAIGVFSDPNGAPIGVWAMAKPAPKPKAKPATKPATKTATKTKPAAKAKKSAKK